MEITLDYLRTPTNYLGELRGHSARLKTAWTTLGTNAELHGQHFYITGTNMKGNRRQLRDNRRTILTQQFDNSDTILIQH